MIKLFAGHPTGANLLMALLMVLGAVSLPQLGRETFPDFESELVEVRVVYPGATAEEVENAICQRIEDAVDGLTDVEEVRCEAREGIGTATIEMRDGGDIDSLVSDIKTEIDAIDSFPDVTETPVVRQLNLTDLVVSIAITGPMAEPDLKVFAEDVKDRLVALPEVSQVTVQGFSERQLRVALDDEALRRYGLSAADVANAIRQQSLDLPSGVIETGEQDVLVRFADERRSEQGLEDLVILGGQTGAEVRLGEIATVTDRFELDEARVFFNGRRAALLQVSKTQDEDTLTVMEAVRAFVEAEQAVVPPGVRFDLTRDVASIVQDRLDMLVENSLQGLVLVFLVLWLFFSFRFSFWVAMALPVSFLGTFFVLTLIDYSINMLTMVALLIAIGLLMDDSIVIAENIASHLQRGKSRLQAAVDGTREVAQGVLSSFATTACVFAPLAFLEGDIGRVLKVVPVVLTITLAVSLIEAFLILPRHLAHSLDRERTSRFRRAFDAGFARVRDRGFGRLVDWAVEWRYLTVGLVILAFLGTAGLLAGGIVKFRAFPAIDGDVVEARILLPQGTPLERTEAAVAQVVAALERVDDALAPRQPGGQPLVRSVLVEFNVNPDAFEAGPHLARVTADLLTSEERDAGIEEIFALWRRELGTVPDVISLTFKEPTVGPAGLPIDIRLQGGDLDDLKSAAQELIAWLARYEGVADLIDDLRPGKPEVRIRLREGAVALGLDAATVADQLRAAYFGTTATEIQVGPESFEIDVRLAPEHQDSFGDLDYFVVALPGGRQVPLSSVATVELGRGVARINRIDGLRTVTVRGEVDTQFGNVNEILIDTRTHLLPELAARYPGVSVALEGEAQAQAETGASFARGFAIGLFGVFLLLSLQFRSYIEPVIVMLAIPLSLIGAVVGHLVLGLDLSMPSVLGAASLAGIVVNDSILLVLFVKQRAARMAVVDAARQAARDRFRPILLTTATTVAGLTPLMFERSLQAQVLVPLVTSLAFGLLAATFLVLIMLPAAYAILHDFGLTSLAREKKEAEEAVPASG